MKVSSGTKESKWKEAEDWVLLSKCAWCDSFPAALSLSSKLFSYCDFIYFMEGKVLQGGKMA